MELFPKVKQKLEQLLYDQELRFEHPIKYHLVKAASSLAGLGMLPPQYQESLANKLNLPRNTFTMFSSVYGAAIGTASYGAMYFGLVKTSDSVKSINDMLETVPVDTIIAVYGSLFVASHIARASISKISKKSQYPYSPIGALTSLGVLGVGKGLENVLTYVKNSKVDATLVDK